MNMIGIDPKVACHALKLDPKIEPKIQRRQPMSVEKYEALKSDVDKLLEKGLIRKLH